MCIYIYIYNEIDNSGYVRLWVLACLSMFSFILICIIMFTFMHIISTHDYIVSPFTTMFGFMSKLLLVSVLI